MTKQYFHKMADLIVWLFMILVLVVMAAATLGVVAGVSVHVIRFIFNILGLGDIQI